MNNPTLDTSKVVFCDLDDTLCKGPYDDASPITKNIDRLNVFKRDGWTVVIWTGRGMITYGGNIQRIEEAYRERTEKWLRRNGVLYNELRFGKPVFALLVDDKSENWSER